MATLTAPAAAGYGSKAARAVLGVLIAPVAVFLVVLVALFLLAGALVAVPLAILAGAATAFALSRWLPGRATAVALAQLDGGPVDPTEHARLVNLIEGLCITHGVTEPDLRLVEDAGANAAAVGTDPRRSTIVVTTGLLEVVDRIALEAVLGRLVAQIKAGSTATRTRAVVVAGVPAAAAETGGLAFLAGIAERPFALARQRHSVVHDDIAAVSLTRYPPGLAAALEAMAERGTAVQVATRATAHLFTADPWPESAARDAEGRFDVFPPIEERLAVLREL